GKHSQIKMRIIVALLDSIILTEICPKFSPVLGVNPGDLNWAVPLINKLQAFGMGCTGKQVVDLMDQTLRLKNDVFQLKLASFDF
ncbi:MAG: hypothetical protein ACOYNF_18050, partial [Rhodoferax sp.]